MLHTDMQTLLGNHNADRPQHLSLGLPFCVWLSKHSLRPEKLFLFQVTQDPQMVLPLQWEELMEVEGVDLKLVFSYMAKQIQSMLAQKDTHLQVCKHT